MVQEFFLYIILSIICFKIFNKNISKLIIDKPSYRSSHIKDIPTSGGLVFLTIYLVNILISKNYYLLILLPIGLLGFLDDLFNLKQVYRLILQFLNIIFIALFFLNFDIFKDIQLANSIIFFVVIFLGLTLVNCINFMDGIDGLVASNMSLILINYTFTNNTAFIGITCSLLVFLFYNWSPAKIFMGDSGSTFLGIILFYLIFTNNDLPSALIMFLTAAPLLMDSITCIFRRILNNENVFSPHKKHLYQRLHQSGMKHSHVSLIYIFSTIILLFFSYFNNLIFMFFITSLLFILGIYLDKRYAIPF